ncbi:hypothetical protein, partial [uncultured Cyclobacterium sp.]|uniref:hypothetical protein n=1 Tax=uncultured Cyclobacterium sp. TaxID=453820 RepID=UPI0030EE3362
SINNGGSNNLITFEGENTSVENLDFSTSPNIETIRLAYNSALGGIPLRTLNLKNGNNTAISELNTSGNFPTLTCIQVDDVNQANQKVTDGDWLIDANTQFSINCLNTCSNQFAKPTHHPLYMKRNSSECVY